MSENGPRELPSLEDLDTRVRAARAREEADQGAKGGPGRGSVSGLGVAMRLTTEFVVGIVVGVAIGWFLDGWLGTRPWLMVLFLLLGGASGIMNAYRAARRMDETVGFGAAQARLKDRRTDN